MSVELKLKTKKKKLIPFIAGHSSKNTLEVTSIAAP
jgi:hypothetical protein